MSIGLDPPPRPSPPPGEGRSPLPERPDEDDGIHIVSVTPVDGVDGSVLRVVVSWMEDGVWVAKTVEWSQT